MIYEELQLGSDSAARKEHLLTTRWKASYPNKYSAVLAVCQAEKLEKKHGRLS
jgi:hypothetical protein